MDARIAVINLFQVDLDKPWNYLRYCCEKAPPLPLTPFWKVGRQCPRSLASLLTTVYFATGVVKNGLYFPRFVFTRRKRCYSFTAWLRLRRSSNDIWRSQLLSLSKKKFEKEDKSHEAFCQVRLKTKILHRTQRQLLTRFVFDRSEHRCKFRSQPSKRLSGPGSASSKVRNYATMHSNTRPFAQWYLLPAHLQHSEYIAYMSHSLCDAWNV